jgi:AcrR family transcriptional regulator
MAARAYSSPLRAEAAAQTRAGILDATIALAYELERVDLTLDQISTRAGRSVQTLLRHFGSLDALIEAAVQRGSAQVAEERRAPDGDIGRSLELLVEHYELRGRFVLRLLAREADGLAVTGPGRLLHRGWVEDVYGDSIVRAGSEAEALTDLLVVATDVYTWKLLRLDRGLSPAHVRERMAQMTDALIRRFA